MEKIILARSEIIELAEKEDKDKHDRQIVCDHCAWAYGDDECVRDGECDSPKLTGFKYNKDWKLIETPAVSKLTDINGKEKDFKYTKFTIEKIKKSVMKLRHKFLDHLNMLGFNSSDIREAWNKAKECQSNDDVTTLEVITREILRDHYTKGR